MTGNRKQPAVWLRRGTLVLSLSLAAFVLGQGVMRVMVGRQPDGSVVLPTNQVIRPLGRQMEFNGRPNAVALSPDGKVAAVLNTGTDAAIVLIDLATGTVKQEFKGAGESASFAGIVYAADGKTLYASQGYGDVLIARVGADGLLTLDAKIDTPKKNKDDNALSRRAGPVSRRQDAVRGPVAAQRAGRSRPGEPQVQRRDSGG